MGLSYSYFTKVKVPDIFPSITDVTVDDFPLYQPGNDFLEAEATVVPPEPYGFTWKFDFTKGDLWTDSSGQFLEVEQRNTVHEWVSHTLNTWRWETPIFGGDIGTEIHNFIGVNTTIDGGTLARVEEEIIEAVSVHDRIDAVGVVVLIPVDYDIFCVFRYSTDDSITSTEVVNV